MEKTIVVKNLSKTYRITTKSKGLLASIKSLINPKYKYIKAVDKINFTISSGEIVGFIGPNGAGKTTTLKMLSGILYPTSSNCTVLGYDPSKRNFDFLRQITLIMGQRQQLWWELPVIDTLKLNQAAYDIDDKTFHNTVNEFVEIFDIKDLLNQQVRTLSLGQRMKCEILASLIHLPKVIFLDEPTIGLDIFTQRKIREMLKKYNERYNATILLTSHYMDDIKAICDRVIIINQGKLIFDNKLEKLVEKYAKNKQITIKFNTSPAKFYVHHATIKYFSPTQATLSISKNKVSEVVYNIMQTYDVEDIDITEETLEDLVEKILQQA